MKTRCLTLLLVGLLGLPAIADAQELIVHPARPAVGPVYTYPNGFYSPYPGIWAPVPYPNWNYPPHWIYSYMRFDDGYRRRDDDEGGKAYRGRDTLSPAVPYSDYLRDQKEALKARDAAAKPAPTADKALFEIRMPKDNAKLYFDGKEAAGEGDVRTFLTPALTPGQTYTFTLKATVAAFPDDLVTEQTVSFRAGEHKVVDLRAKR